MNLQAPELIIILVVVLLLFGGAKLPQLARSLGQAQKEFKDGMHAGASDATSPTETPTERPEGEPATPTGDDDSGDAAPTASA